MSNKTELMKEKIAILNEAAKAYYTENREVMSNLEYDKLYDELVSLEKETGITLSGSPTVTVGYEVLDELPKEHHETRMLSLDKTKEVDALKDFLSGYVGFLAWKLDGLTVVLTYVDGKLEKAVTRGTGDIGEVITSNARVFKNLPHTIPFKGELVVRGEAIIRYSDFEKINSEIDDVFAQYKNPRNLCSGSVRQLNSKITAERNVRFYAFSIVKVQTKAQGQVQAEVQEKQIQRAMAIGDAQIQMSIATGSDQAKIDGSNQPQILTDDNISNQNQTAMIGDINYLQVSRKEQMEWLAAQGFEIVEYKMVDASNVEETVKWFATNVATSDLPSDGLVLSFDDIQYGKSLGNTAKFPRDSIAFKWEDEIKETTLEEIEWSASRTGLINPIAVFAPVDLDGSTVSRASVHNISIVKELELGIGDTITVYKANMIIPQIAENLTRSGNIVIPKACPVCNEKTRIKSDSDVETLICINENCPAKQIKQVTHFVGRNAMNIDGFSEASIEKFIANNIIKESADLFKLDAHEDKIVMMEGFGEKSFQNLVAAINVSRKTSPARLLYALGIPTIGVTNAKVICKSCDQDWSKIQNLTKEKLTKIYGIGEIMAESYVEWFKSEKNRESVEKILAEIEFETEDAANTNMLFEGKTFVVTGSLEHFDNREALVEVIENGGGKTASSVSPKTSYLINNDLMSNSSKNKKAKELGVPIISEADFMAWLESGSEPNN